MPEEGKTSLNIPNLIAIEFHQSWYIAAHTPYLIGMSSRIRVSEFSIWVCNLVQEKEYKDALEAYNEKNREKVQLITRLMEVSKRTF